MIDVPYAEVAAAPGLAWKSALASAAAGAVVGWSVGWDWPLLFLLPLVPVGVALSVIDWRTRLLPTRIVLPTLAVTAVLVAVCWAVTQDTDAAIRALEAVIFDRLGDRDVLVATKEGLLVVLAPTAPDATTDLGRLMHGELSRLPRGRPWRVAVGRPHAGLYGIARSYEEAPDHLWVVPVVCMSL